MSTICVNKKPHKHLQTDGSRKQSQRDRKMAKKSHSNPIFTGDGKSRPERHVDSLTSNFFDFQDPGACSCFYAAIFVHHPPFLPLLLSQDLPTPRIMQSTPFTPPQPDRLAVFLQFRNQAIAVLDHIGVLLVLIVRAVGLDDAVDAVDGAGDAIGGDEFGEVAE